MSHFDNVFHFELERIGDFEEFWNQVIQFEKRPS